MRDIIRISRVVWMVLFLFVSMGAAQESKVRVVAERARIYAEASTESYRIETVKKGTILTLFGTKQADENWLYVYYQSPRWGSKVTGFIQAEMVEGIAEEEKVGAEPVKQPEGGAEKKQAEKPAEKPAEMTEAKAKQELETKPAKKLTAEEAAKESVSKPEKEKIAEIKEEPVRIERIPGTTALPSHPVIPFPLSFVLGQNPRYYQVITEEEGGTGDLPQGVNPDVQKEDTLKTEVWKREVVIPEKTEVTEKEREIPKAEVREETPPPEKKPQIVTQKKPAIPRVRDAEGRPLFTLSLGYGPSLGGFGGFVQLNTSGSLSVHWGFGYYPTSMFYPDFDWVKGKALYSVGVKYYLPWKSSQVRPYIDLQYGGISVEAVRVVTGIWYYTYIYEDVQKTLWGPSLMAGIELRFGSFGLNGAVGGSYVVTKWDFWDQPLFVTADIGLLLYF